MKVSDSRIAITLSDRSIIKAALQLAQPRWTSEDVAKQVGTSQSAVARAWRRAFDPNSLPRSLPRGIEITEVSYQNGQGLITARIIDPKPIGAVPPPAMRSIRRVPLQTLLAGLPAHLDAINSHDAKPKKAITADEWNNETLVIHTAQIQRIGTGVTFVQIEPESWQSLLSYLIVSAHHTLAGNLRKLHHELIQWGNDPSIPFHWVADAQLDRAQIPAAPAINSLRSTQQVIADEIFETIVTNIWNGKLTAGDRITESSLARQLHTTRNQTRDALRSLASSGLIDHHPVRGVLVPTPRQVDIADIYAARRALGTEILRRVIEQEGFNTSEVKLSLDNMISISKTGNSYETGNADLHFQDVIAQNSGMRNIPQLFAILGKQLRIYIAVLGMGYVYSIEAMVEDDTALYNHLLSKNFAGAREGWQKKLDDSLKFMTGHIGKRR